MKVRIFSLRFKILAALSLLAGVTFFLVSHLTIEHMKQLGKYSVDACSSLGKSVVLDSKNALMDQSREELQSLVLSQAQLIDYQLKRVSGEMNLVANLCSRYLESPQEKQNDLTIYFSKDKPGNPNDYASYYLSAGINQESVLEELQCLGRLQPILKFVNSNNPGSHIIYIGTPSGIFVSSPWTQQPSGYDPRLRIWYQGAAKSRESVWVGPYISSTENKLVLTCAKAARDKDGRVIAVCAIDVEVRSILKNLISTQLEPQGKVFLLDNEGNVLVRRELSETGYSWENEYKKENLLKSPDPGISEVARKMTDGKRGCDDLAIPGEPVHFVAYYPIMTTGWSIGIAIPKKVIIAAALNTEKIIHQDTLKHSSFINNHIENSRIVYISLGFIVLLLILGAGAYLSAKITAPILFLKKQAEEIGRGNLDLKIELKTGDELEHLADTFNQMTGDLRKYIASLEETIHSREKIERELAVSREIQASLLPPSWQEQSNASPFIDVQAMMEPAKEIGGDFYDYFMVNETVMFFCIGDVSSKGIPAALFMAMTKTLLAHEAECSLSPTKVLFNVNNVLEKDNDASMFATVFCGFLDTATGVVNFSNGGHNHPLICRNGGNFEFIHTANGIAIGPSEMKENVWQMETLQLNPGDRIFLYSDGVSEALNESRLAFGKEKLLEALNSHKEASSNKFISCIREEIRRYAGQEPQSDDIAMLYLNCYGTKANE
ncbi:MAG: SpoIIE family protein phosphatase [Victivallaceae bacterium]|jgi:sigma-B regulation protein RsbU (phosphoserine phosphatase)